jgi:murein DD-endopeptidase MepM/ murein hydrolase activator NlpD
MTRRGLLDRLQLIAATATLTSAAWIVLGTFYLDRIGEADTANAPEALPPIPAEHGSVPEGEGLAIPVLGVSPADLVDTFEDSRTGGPHEAIDIMAPAGTPVIAAGPGTIEKLYLSDAGGNTIYLRSIDRRTIHYYAHLRSYEPGLREGQAVARGQRLGEVGSTGNADPSGPHLHFAIFRTQPDAQWWESAATANPYPLLNR